MKIPKILNLVNYHIFIVSVQRIQTNVKLKINLKIKKSNNSTFVILIFEIPKFRKIGCSTFGRSKILTLNKKKPG